MWGVMLTSAYSWLSFSHFLMKEQHNQFNSDVDLFSSQTVLICKIKKNWNVLFVCFLKYYHHVDDLQYVQHYKINSEFSILKNLSEENEKNECASRERTVTELSLTSCQSKNTKNQMCKKKVVM